MSILLLGSFSFALTPISALGGSLFVTALEYLLGRRRGLIDIKETGRVSKFGHLEGLNEINSANGVEIYP